MRYTESMLRNLWDIFRIMPGRYWHGAFVGTFILTAKMIKLSMPAWEILATLAFCLACGVVIIFVTYLIWLAMYLRHASLNGPIVLPDRWLPE